MIRIVRKLIPVPAIWLKLLLERLVLILRGCLLPTSFSLNDSVCSAICAGSMPVSGLPSGNVSESCAYTVILATPTADGYTFTPINEGDNHDLLIVFLWSDDHKFAGFN